MEITTWTSSESITTNEIRADTTRILNDLLCAPKFLLVHLNHALLFSHPLLAHFEEYRQGTTPGAFHPTPYLSYTTLVSNYMQTQQQWQRLHSEPPNE